MESNSLGQNDPHINYGRKFGSLEWGVLQHMEITLDGLIWDLGVLNYGFGYV